MNALSQCVLGKLLSRRVDAGAAAHAEKALGFVEGDVMLDASVKMAGDEGCIIGERFRSIPVIKNNGNML